MSTSNSYNLEKPDTIDETLILLNEHSKHPLYTYMFLIGTPILLLEYNFALNKFNIFLEWARHL